MLACFLFEAFKFFVEMVERAYTVVAIVAAVGGTVAKDGLPVEFAIGGVAAQSGIADIDFGIFLVYDDDFLVVVVFDDVGETVRRKWQPTPVFLPRECQGWGSLVSCCLWGRTELDTTEAT